MRLRKHVCAVELRAPFIEAAIVIGMAIHTDADAGPTDRAVVNSVTCADQPMRGMTERADGRYALIVDYGCEGSDTDAPVA